jgi:MarR family transcriptional regulator, transcriptional regulator for hemolysin
MKEPVGRKMDKIGRMFQTLLQTDLKQLDIDRSFYPLLLIDEGGGLTQQELARKLLCDKVQIVRIIDYLSSNGYVERVQHKVDKRKYELTVTEKAKKLIPEIKDGIVRTSTITFKGLTNIQIEELYNMLDIIENNLLQKQYTFK